MTDTTTTPLPLSPILSTTPSNVENKLVLSSGKKSRFRFHSDTKAPVELKVIEKETHKKQTEFRKRVNDLDHQIASWMSRFADEILERDRETVAILDEQVCEPLERCAERFMRRLELEFGNLHGATTYKNGKLATEGDEDSEEGSFDDDTLSEEGEDHADATYTASVTNTGTDTTSPLQTMPITGSKQYGETDDADGNHDNDERNATDCKQLGKASNLQSISDDISRLSSNLMHHVHVTTPSLRGEHIDSFHRKLQEAIPPKLHMEKTKAAKREQAIFQKFESMAGLASRSLAEENASRVAELKLLEEKILDAGGWDERRSTRFMDEIKEIRDMLEKERQERIESDQAVLDAIVRTRTMLHKTLLESVGE